MMRHASLAVLLLLLAACDRLAGPDPGPDSPTDADDPSAILAGDDGSAEAGDGSLVIQSRAAPGTTHFSEPLTRRVTELPGNPPELCLPDLDSR